MDSLKLRKDCTLHKNSSQIYLRNRTLLVKPAPSALKLSKSTQAGVLHKYASQQFVPRQNRITAAAAASISASEGSSDSDSPKNTLILGCLFGAWYLANIYFNIYNKQVLQSFAFPITITTLQFIMGSCLAVIFWTFGFVKRPQITPQLVTSIFPLAVVHTLGNLLTNVSLGAVAVSFTHTIKAMEPFFSVVLSAMFLGDKPSPAVLATLLPIVAGVAMASVSEVTFNWKGFLSAMGSNLTFQSRNVLSKKLMISKGSLDNINLFSIITIISAIISIPIALLSDGYHFTPAGMQALGVSDPTLLGSRLLAAGLCFHLYQQVSYMILSRVSPVTHSIGNCVKRVVVIVASVFVFRNPMSLQNAIGTMVALAGVFAYGQVTRKSGKGKSKSKGSSD